MSFHPPQNAPRSYTYDGTCDALYLKLSDQPIARQEEMADGTIIDVTEAGQCVGIEVLSAKHRWDRAAVIKTYGLDEDSAGFIYFISNNLPSWGASS